MVDHSPGIYILQGFQRHFVPLFLLIDPSGQGLLHHPSPRSLQARGHSFNLFGKSEGDMRRQHLRF
jgi:hypothetical protein